MRILRSLLGGTSSGNGNGRHRAYQQTRPRLTARGTRSRLTTYAAVLCGAAIAALGLSGATVAAQTPTDPPSAIYVTNVTTNTVSVVNPATRAIITTIPVGTGPKGLAVTPDGSKVYVANFDSGTVSVISTATNTVIAAIPVGSQPIAVAANPNGSQVYVANSNATTVSVINTATNAVTTINLPFFAPQAVAFSPGGALAYVVGADSVAVIDTATNTLVTTIPVSGNFGLRGVAVSPDGSTVYVTGGAGLSVINATTNTVVKTVPTGSTPIGVAVSPDGTVYVANSGSATVSVVSPATNTVTATVPVGATPTSVAVGPDGKVYVTNFGATTVSVIDPAANNAVSTIPGFTTPYGVAAGPAIKTSEPLVVTATAHSTTSNISTANGYRVVIMNPNPASAVVDTISVVLPPGFTYTTGTTVGETTDNPAIVTDPATGQQTLTWTGPFTVPASPGAGGAGEITIDFDVTTSEVPGTYTIDATATSDDAVTPATNTAPITVEAAADLSLTKMASAATVVPGQTFTYSLVGHNAGPSDATGVEITDTLPAGLAFDATTSSPGCSATGQVVTCSIGSLADGASSGPVTIEVTVAGDAPPGMVVNDAVIHSPLFDPDEDNNSASTPVEVTNSDNLSITKTASPATIPAGGTVTFTITVHNAGPAAAEATLSDELPGGLSLVSITGTGCVPGTLTCLLPVPAGGARTVTVVAKAAADASGLLTNEATVTAPGNVSGTVTATADVIVTPSAGLMLSKVSAPPAVAAGQTVHYLLAVGNAGPSTATDVTVADSLPAGLTFVPGESSAGCTVTGGTPATGQTVTCTVGSIAAGDIVRLDIAAGTSPSMSPGTVTDHAEATDSTGAHATASADTTIDVVADLSITKTAPDAFAGTDVTWTITVPNAGPSTADGAIVADTLPAGFTITGVTTDSGTCTHTGQNLSCTLGSIPPGGAATITVVTASAPDLVPPGQTSAQVPNTATVDYPGDPDTDNNTVTFPVTLFAKAHLVPVKTVTPAPLIRGGLATYRITVTNQGPSVATGITATDTLPPGLTFDAAASDARCSLTNAAAGRVTCSAPGPLAPGASITFTVVARVSAALSVGSVIVNDAVVSASQYDPDPADAARAVSVIGLPSIPVTG